MRTLKTGGAIFWLQSPYPLAQCTHTLIKRVIMTPTQQESVFDSLDKSNAELNAEHSVDQHLRVAYWSNTQDRVTYNADKVHTLSFYLEGGEGSKRLDIQSGQGHSGSLCLLPQYHHSVWEISSPFRFAHLYFSDDSIKQFASTTLDIEPRLIQIPELTFHDDQQLVALARQLFLSSDASPLSYQQNTLEIFRYLLSNTQYCLNEQLRLTGGLSPAALAKVKEYIHQYFDQSISIADLSQQANLSDFHLLRMFKQSTGFTPNDYVNYVRVETVKQELLTEKSLSQIAQECGFSHQSHMNRTFKKWASITPGQFRSALQTE